MVTGGRGLVARHLVLALLASTAPVWSQVRILDLAPTLTLDPDEHALRAAITTGRAAYISADLRDPGAVSAALRSATAVFHMAAPDSSIPDAHLHMSVSRDGTRHVIDACLAHGTARRLVFTSSPSAVAPPGQPARDAHEAGSPYPDRFSDPYAAGKAAGEQLVLAANGRVGAGGGHRLLTCAVRPSAVFGPGDRLFVPALVAAARAGRGRVVVGDGENLYDWTYVDNVVHAHLCAERALARAAEGQETAAGQAFFVTNGEPVRFWEFVGRILEGLGYPRPTVRVPVGVVLPVAYAAEWAARVLGRSPGQFTPARMRTVSAHRTFSIDRARRVLGYEPVVSLDEGVRRTVAAFPHLRKDAAGPVAAAGPAEKKRRARSRRAAGGEEPSKVHRVIGSGALADLLLWRDATRSLVCLAVLLPLLYALLVRGVPVLALAAQVAMAGLSGTFLYAAAVQPALGNARLPRLPAAPPQVPEAAAVRAALGVRRAWNLAAGAVARIAREPGAWGTLARLVLVQRALRFLGRFSGRALVGVLVLEAFAVPYLYEQYEEEVDAAWVWAGEVMAGYRDLVVSKIPAGFKQQQRV